jgi:hypothetical protein
MPNTTHVINKKKTKEEIVLVWGLEVITDGVVYCELLTKEPRMRFELTIFLTDSVRMLYP